MGSDVSCSMYFLVGGGNAALLQQLDWVEAGTVTDQSIVSQACTSAVESFVSGSLSGIEVSGRNESIKHCPVGN
jgi:hypothetical protein